MTPLQATIVVTVSDEQIYQNCVVASLAADTISDKCDLIEIRNAKSQASALNQGIERAKTDLIICPHQDIYFHPGWFNKLIKLANTTPKWWGVLGSAGTMLGGAMFGTHSGLGMAGYEHVEAQTVDGSFLVVRKSNSFRFDENLTRFHGYDVDICLESQMRGLAVYVLNVPMEHRTRWNSTAGQGAQDFQNALNYVARKWHERGVGPIYTTFGTY